MSISKETSKIIKKLTLDNQSFEETINVIKQDSDNSHKDGYKGESDSGASCSKIEKDNTSFLKKETIEARSKKGKEYEDQISDFIDQLRKISVTAKKS